MSAEIAPPPAAALPLIEHWIDGRTVASSARAPVFNPALGRQIRAVAMGGHAEIALAASAAERAQPAWAALSPQRRARHLFELKQLLLEERAALARAISEEHGKTIQDAVGEVTRGIEVVEYACAAPQLLTGAYSHNVGGNADTFSVRVPLGIVAGITPFNFPAMVPLWMFPLALACGNAFILKPSERDPSAALLLARLAQRAGVPDGVLNVVHGDRGAVAAVLEEPRIAAVSFIGSTPVARHVQLEAIRHGKRVQALGGAKNHLLVMPDADLDVTVEAIVGAAYGSAGERCMAASIVLAVGDELAERLIAHLARRLAGLRVGAPDAPDTEMGPLVTQAHRERVREYIDAGVREGAALVVDGRDLSGAALHGGFFLGPSLFDRVRPHMRIYREEIFGPVLGIVRVADLASAVRLINAHELANGAVIFTASGAAARRFAAEVETGMVGVNVAIPVPVAHHSFGGWRSSMYGDHHVYGEEGVRFYTRLKCVTQRWLAPPQGGSRLTMPAGDETL